MDARLTPCTILKIGQRAWRWLKLTLKTKVFFVVFTKFSN